MGLRDRTYLYRTSKGKETEQERTGQEGMGADLAKPVYAMDEGNVRPVPLGEPLHHLGGGGEVGDEERRGGVGEGSSAHLASGLPAPMPVLGLVVATDHEVIHEPQGPPHPGLWGPGGLGVAWSLNHWSFREPSSRHWASSALHNPHCLSSPPHFLHHSSLPIFPHLPLIRPLPSSPVQGP